MGDTTVPIVVDMKENALVRETSEPDESENQNVEIIAGESSPVQKGILNLPDAEGSSDSNAVLQVSEVITDVAELTQEGKSAGGDSKQYEDIEEECEQQSEDGSVETVTKKQVIMVKKSNELEIIEKVNNEIDEEIVEEEYEKEELNEQGQPRTVVKTREVKVPEYNFGKEESFIEKEEEYEEEEMDETGEIKIIKKTRLVKVAIEKSESYEEIEEEYDEDETDENNETVTVHKKRIIKIPKHIIRGPKEDIHEVIKKEKSVAEESLEEEEVEEDEEFKEDELEEETPKAELEDEDVPKKLKKRRRRKQKNEDEAEEHVESDQEEQEEEDEKETVSISEKKSVASLSSAEVLLAEEKLAMAQQYEILTKLRSEHTALRRKNLFLNNKLVQYFKKQKMEHVFAETKEDPVLEQQYLKKLMIFYETNQQMTEEKLKINTEWEAQRSINEALGEKVKQGWEELFCHKKEIAARLIDPKTGRTVPCDKVIEDLLNRQEAQLKLISESRLAQIKLKRRIEEKKIERQMKNAVNFMDYEKLSSLKEYYMDKITERDIEIEEVSQKVTAMDDTLSQVREQLRKKEDELAQEQEHLQRITLELSNKRAKLNLLKVTRHKTEKNTAKIKQQSGLLAYPVLLKDYEEKTQLLQHLMSQIEALKQAHRVAVIRIRKLRDIVKRRTHERESLDISPSTVTFSNINNIF